MTLLYLMWTVFVFCGAFMGWSAVRAVMAHGPAVDLLLNVAVFWGIALYGVPKLFRLLSGKR